MVWEKLTVTHGSQIPPTPLGFDDRSGIHPDAAVDA
jgi:hypothetical protein